MKTDIELIDRNFANLTVENEDIRWLSCHEDVFRIYGVFYDEKQGLFIRVPDEVARSTSPHVHHLSRMTAGGRLRFVTDSPFVAIKAAIPALKPMPHMPITGSHGFAVHADGVFQGRYSPSFDDFLNAKNLGSFSENIYFVAKKNLLKINQKQIIDVYFPLYGGVSDIFIGVAPDSIVEAAPPYTYEKPFLFYGSSITQGGCVSRPGNDYVAVIARRLDSDYINLGFSGNGNAEDAIIDYICSLDVSCIAFDYNLYNNEKSKSLPSHYSVYERIRARKPNVPILLHDKPGCEYSYHPTRASIIRETYDRAIAAGDRHIAHIYAEELFGEFERDACTVDGNHPNDLGASRIADAMCGIIKDLIDGK